MTTTIVLVLVFYLFLPLVGALSVRTRWRRFRKRIRSVPKTAELRFQDLQEFDSPSVRTFQFWGRLEAFEPNARLWLGDGTTSVSVDYRGADVYFLEDDENFPQGVGEWQSAPVPPEPPRRVDWTRIGALPEGTQFLVCGALTLSESQRLRFESIAKIPLLIVAYEGPRSTALPRALWSGRQSIEYWNSMTPLALLLGFATLLVSAYMELRTPGSRAAGIVSLAFALLPTTFFLPPGIFFFYGFSRIWSQCRHFRALRDLASFAGESHDILRSKSKKKARRGEFLAHVVFLLGAGLNAALLVTILRFWIY